MTEPIRIGTRGSQLALWQANETAKLLSMAGFSPQIVIIRTTGDKQQDVSLADVGGKGLFIKELEEALDHGEIDMAVHSLKDVPSIIPPRFSLVAFLERADPRDAWLHPKGASIQSLKGGAVVGTSAPRRRAQIIERYPHLKIEMIRGNVETRINKAKAGKYDGIVLAHAGLSRLGMTNEITSVFSVDEMVPAAGQGIVAIEALRDNRHVRHAAAAINRPAAEMAAACERGVLQKFGERLDCYSAVAVHATIDDGWITVRAFAADYEGTRSVRSTHRASRPDEVVRLVYEDLIAKGAMELICARTTGS